MTNYLASLVSSVRCDTSATSFQLFCQMLLLSVRESEAEDLLFAGQMDAPEVIENLYSPQMVELRNNK